MMGAMISAPASLFGARFALALAHRPLPADVLAFLSAPAWVARARLSAPVADASVQRPWAWRLRFGDVLGPCKGGVRFHPGVTEENLVALAARILLKCAVNDLPHGGAAGGVAIDPKTLGPGDREALARDYVRAFFDVIGPERDILSPDLGTDARLMAVMSAEYDRLARRFVPAAINGKPPGQGGVLGRHGATARGAFAVMETLLPRWDAGIAGARFSVQGFGAAGGTFAAEAVARGARVVAASDTSAALLCSAGLPVDALLAAKAAGRPLATLALPGVTLAPPDALFAARTDWLVCAALPGQVTGAVATELDCRGVVEIANAAVDDAGDEVLRARGVHVLPDVVVNAGGITVSHFEWVQGRTGAPLAAAEVAARLDARMRETARRLDETATAHGVPLTVAAQMMAQDRLRAACGA